MMVYYALAGKSGDIAHFKYSSDSSPEELKFQAVYGMWAAIVFFGENTWVTIFKILVANIINVVIAFIILVILIVPKVLDMKEAVEAERTQAAAENIGTIHSGH